MEVTLTTPALLFPAISLLLLAYTNRFLALATLIRGLRSRYESEPDSNLFNQIKNLRRRIILIRNMQAFGIASILTCVFTMFAVYLGYQILSGILFGFSLIFMILSLLLSFQETLISVSALKLELSKTEGLGDE
jgi:membrane protein required for beta-lactamase induction